MTAGHRAGRIRDPKRAGVSALVRHTSSVPDPFRVGGGVVVTVGKQGSIFAGEPDSLITACPSKFTVKAAPSTASTAGSVVGR